MDFGNACLFNKKPEDMRRIGALGGRARGGICDSVRPAKCRLPESTAGRTKKPPLRPSGASMPSAPGWLGWNVARHGGRAERVANGADVSCKENYAACVKKIMPPFQTCQAKSHLELQFHGY